MGWCFFLWAHLYRLILWTTYNITQQGNYVIYSRNRCMLLIPFVPLQLTVHWAALFTILQGFFFRWFIKVNFIWATCDSYSSQHNKLSSHCPYLSNIQSVVFVEASAYFFHCKVLGMYHMKIFFLKKWTWILKNVFREVLTHFPLRYLSIDGKVVVKQYTNIWILKFIQTKCSRKTSKWVLYSLWMFSFFLYVCLCACMCVWKIDVNVRQLLRV